MCINEETLEHRKILWNEVRTDRMNGKISYLHYRTIAVYNRPPS